MMRWMNDPDANHENRQVALVASSIVTVGEVLAEIIGLDDNLVIPMLGVLGVRIALSPQFTSVSFSVFDAS